MYQPDHFGLWPQRIDLLQRNVELVFQGKPRIVELALVCLIAGGHLLLEDVPGVGKTTLAMALAKSLGLGFKRVQFTSDMLPADILGVSIWSKQTESFHFVPGPLFAQLVLADEINRTTPRTQSALLEAMSEGRVSVDNVTHPLPAPFHVIATQNPLESFGTYPLPESQLDRFLMRLSIGYPGTSVELDLLLKRDGAEPVEGLSAVMTQDDFVALCAQTDRVTLAEPVARYILDVVAKTRQDPRIRVGVSTRGALALARAVRARALVHKRRFCLPDDARRLFGPCLAHRLSFGAKAGAVTREGAEAILEEIVAGVPIPV